MKNIFKIAFPLLCVIGLFFFLPSVAKADTCPNNPYDNPCWVTKASMPTARRDLGVASDSAGKIYAVGGFDGQGNFLNTFEMYDPSNNTWTTKASVPVARNDMGFAFDKYNGKFYFGGGYNSGLYNDFYEYDPTTDAWTAKASMPTASAGLRFAVATNGKLYSIGGGYLDGTYVSNVEEYDPSTDSWSLKSAIPTPRSDASLVTAPNGKMYLIGGGALTDHGLDFIANADQYDPMADTWTAKAPMSLNRYDMGGSLDLQGNILVVGGGTDSGYTSLVEEYNTSTNTWTTKTPLPDDIFALGQALGSDGRIHVLGGQTISSGAISTQYTGFTPDPPQITQLNPAKVWLSKGILDIGVKMDVLAQVYEDSTLVSSGEVDSVQVGSGGFGNATLVSIPFNTFTPLNFGQGSQLKIKVSARNACTGSLVNFATAKLWFNDSQANSQFGATIGANTTTYYLLNSFALSPTVGTGPKQNIAVAAGARCSAFKSFGTWSITP